MKAIVWLFGFLAGVVAVLWTQAQIPAPQPVLAPIEVTRIVVATPALRAPSCLAPTLVFANLDGGLVHCADQRYEWRVRP